MSASASEYKPTIGFICPLHVELQAVRAVFDEDLGERQIYVDGDLQNYYHYGMIGSRTVVAVSFAEKRVGPVQAALYTGRLLLEHQSLNNLTSSCFLVGVAAGIWSVKEDVRLGDVVIATRVVDWTSGKIITDDFESTEDAKDVSNEVQVRLPRFCENMSRLSKRILHRVDTMRTRDEDEADLHWECPGMDQDVLFKPDVPHRGGSDCEDCEKQVEVRKPRDPYLPRVHRGLIATGNVVLKDATTRERLRRDRHNKVLAVEMEASAVLLAHRRFIVIRGICDYADSHKNKRWQEYAAATAAACTRLWIDDFLLADSSQDQFSSPTRASTWSNVQPVTPERRRVFERTTSLLESPQSLDRMRTQSDQESSSATNRLHTSSTDSNSVRTNSSSLRTQHTDSLHQEWRCLLDVQAHNIDLKIEDGGPGGKPLRVNFGRSRIKLESEDEPSKEHPDRRISVVEESNPQSVLRSVWMPGTRVRITRKDTNVQLQFSNCNQRRQKLAGKFATRNGVALYETTYDASKPNVHLDINLLDEIDAANFSQHLLLKLDHPEAHNSRLQKTLSRCTIMRRAEASISGEHRSLSVWSRDKDYEEVDIGFFAQKTTFEITTRRGLYNVYIGYLHKLVYEPVDSHAYSSEPPAKVKNNEDGRPSRTRLDGGDSSSNGLNMLATHEEVYEVLAEIVERPRRWVIKDFFLGVEISEIKTTFKRKRAYKLGNGQVTIWMSPEHIRLLILLQAPEPPLTDPRWIACTSPRHPADSHVLQAHDYEVELGNVDVVEGDYLSIDAFLPSSDNMSRQNFQRGKTIRLRFGNDHTRYEFEESIREVWRS